MGVSVATVITHRNNLTEKLGTRSVSALTIFAVMHGIVRILAAQAKAGRALIRQTVGGLKSILIDCLLFNPPTVLSSM